MRIIKIVWRFESSQIIANKPPKTVRIMIIEALKSKEFNSFVINGGHFISIQKQKQIKIKIKKLLFWNKISPVPTLPNEIMRMIAIFLNKKKNSLYFIKIFQLNYFIPIKWIWGVSIQKETNFMSHFHAKNPFFVLIHIIYWPNW